MSNIYLKVEVYPGMDIHNASRDACKLSDKFMIPVNIRFNGVSLFAYPGHSVQVEDRAIDMVIDYHRRLKYASENG
jgi:hypothetical protein